MSSAENDGASADTSQDQTATADQQASKDDEREIRETVQAFGERLRMVSVLAPDSIVIRDIREQYGPFVTPDLLAEWTANPKEAPGREVSSPWPEKIEITSIEEQSEGEYRVEGQIIYVTSAEEANGEAASTEDVDMVLMQGDDGRWLLSHFEKTDAA